MGPISVSSAILSAFENIPESSGRAKPVGLPRSAGLELQRLCAGNFRRHVSVSGRRMATLPSSSCLESERERREEKPVSCYSEMAFQDLFV